MKTFILKPRTNRAVWPAILALAAATAVAGGGMATAEAAKLKAPTLQQGLLTIDGGSGNDTIVARLQAGHPDVLEVDLDGDGTADFFFARANVTSIAIKGGSGSDVMRIDESGGIFTTAIPTTMDGGSGDDTMLGGSGAERLVGGSGGDFADGNRGNDSAEMGSGSDTFVWDPGDGSDTIEGDSGTDTMLFNGANIAEKVELSANGNRLRFTRDVANIVMDTDSVERVVFNALGGVDVVTVNDLGATDVTQVDVDLAAVGGGTDNAVDQLVANGSPANDSVRVSGGAGAVNVAGLAAAITVLHAEPADQLAVKGLAGNDRIDASGLAAGAMSLTLDGGEGDDSLLGGAGDDVLIGGPGLDTLDGGPGNDTVTQ